MFDSTDSRIFVPLPADCGHEVRLAERIVDLCEQRVVDVLAVEEQVFHVRATTARHADHERFLVVRVLDGELNVAGPIPDVLGELIHFVREVLADFKGAIDIRIDGAVLLTYARRFECEYFNCGGRSPGTNQLCESVNGTHEFGVRHLEEEPLVTAESERHYLFLSIKSFSTLSFGWVEVKARQEYEYSPCFYSTVTDFARLRGISIGRPRARAT